MHRCILPDVGYTLTRSAGVPCAKDDAELAADEIIVVGKVDGEADVPGVAKSIGFDAFTTDVSCTDSKSLSFQDCELSVRTGKRSPDAAGTARVSKAVIDVCVRESKVGTEFDVAAGVMTFFHVQLSLSLIKLARQRGVTSRRSDAVLFALAAREPVLGVIFRSKSGPSTHRRWVCEICEKCWHSCILVCTCKGSGLCGGALPPWWFPVAMYLGVQSLLVQGICGAW